MGVCAYAELAYTAEFFVDNAGALILGAAPVIASANVTPDIIQEMKLKYGKVKILTVVADEAVFDDDGNETEPEEVYYFMAKRPDRSLMKMFGEKSKSGDYSDFNEALVKNLIVGGDMEALEIGCVYGGAIKQLAELVKPGQSFLSRA